ncbi:1,4-alpha-glucan branching enzyme [Stenotrophomonas sp. ESTM1D_MKCIP4_1]|uniref:1,4-alpha-glucan branching protein GlgB n=1 Tax=Stenotrophomonas sp. ESTM1D_MKCIP4_1 TaxID=2072414 RepID=UPI000D53C4ED|nr:1,4-alpha-glucan branching protein GlgB [Stenotrophomonas sp. ESTM1D_MKCIP4_1]AWH53636.1 1,4-alpha-glucan branching enzyme [Stenotrophomonas sp. ESTM1D_MKCIP4_1]
MNEEGRGVVDFEYGSEVLGETVVTSKWELQALVQGNPADAFALLGPHIDAKGERLIRVLVPHAQRVEVIESTGSRWDLRPTDLPGLYEGRAGADAIPLLVLHFAEDVQQVHDAYAFGPLLDEALLQRMHHGDAEAIRALGATEMTVQGVEGVRFAVWAPNTRRVAVVGDFNGWDGRRHPMRLRHAAGVWELFVPGVKPGACYKFRLIGADGQGLPDKLDPMARWAERSPATASRVASSEPLQWNDAGWLQRRAQLGINAPLSIYEVHAGSWQRGDDGSVLDWDALADRLIPHVAGLGFTHIELLPISEHPFGGSWGYQPLGIYAPTARYGTPEAFARFVDRCHQAGLGVIVDWVSAHFPDDAHGLAQFDGTALYEHADPREGKHADWDTLIYNYGRNEVAAYLIGSALEWIERFHIDGLRVDAVASMLYRDYSRPEGQWVPNALGGRENLEAVGFLQKMNQTLRGRFPDVLVIAEESTAWPGVTHAVADGGLGFTHKWNMGWMHDTLHYLQRDPVHRQHHHSEISFGLVYAFSERFVLPLSHDEVVHGKGSLLGKMVGHRDQQFAQLRAYYAFMWAHPGSKLLFMGGEFGQAGEWAHQRGLEWEQAASAEGGGLMRLVGDLNAQLLKQPALHRDERDERGFAWSVADDNRNSVYAFIRQDPEGRAPAMLVVSNFTPVLREGYRVGVPEAGLWSEQLNTDSHHYAGGNRGNLGAVATEARSMHGHAQSLRLTLPPMSTLYLQVIA